MAPLPPIWDPYKSVDRLPQPFRMIDKILAEIVEKALDTCLAKDKQKRVVQATHIDVVISPHAVVVASGSASCFTTLGVGGMAIVGTLAGELMTHTARDPTLVGKQQAHSSAVTALDIGHIAATGTKVVVSVSRERVAVHEVIIKSCELRLLAQMDLPLDPDLPSHEGPCGVYLSSNAGHVAVCWPSGPVAVYEVALPPCLYDSGIVDRPPDAPPLDLSGGQLVLTLHFPLKVINTLLVGNTVVGACNVVWQQQQRPDKSGKSDRNHRPAKGVYMWWTNCNKLVLSYIRPPSKLNDPNAAAADQGGVKLPPINAPPATPPGPPATPPGKGGAAAAAGGKGGAAAGGKGGPAGGAAGGAVVDPLVQEKAGVGAGGEEVRRSPSKGWLLPMGITHSCFSESGKMLAFGLSDGSTLVWDDHFGSHTRILPRMPAPVTALAFVNGAPNLLFVTSADGSVYLADLNKPEDSHMSRTKLPHAAHLIYFLPNDPFAVCVCYGDQEQMPRLVWFNMQEEKLAAELSGKNATPDNLGFGRSGLSIPPVPIAALSADFTPPPIPTGMAGAVPPTPKRGSTPPTPSLAALGGAPPSPSPLPPGAEGLAKESSTAGEQAAAACAAMTKAVMESRPWPAVSFRDAYLVAGGPIVPSSSFRPPENEAPPPPDKLPQESHLYLYKIDAIARMLLPEEMANAASKSLLNRMLADLNPPKIRRSRVKMGVADPEAPKPPPSAMRKATDVAPDEAMGGRRHIKFNETDLEGLLNEEQKSGKLFKKETIKGGYSDGRSKQIADPSGGGGGILDLSAFGGGAPAAPSNVPAYMQERPQSPPWHHTNPLARIHPDWEEAAVLTRIMDKLGTKGGGRRRRERRLGTVAREMQGKYAKESGPRPALLFQ